MEPRDADLLWFAFMIIGLPLILAVTLATTKRPDDGQG